MLKNKKYKYMSAYPPPLQILPTFNQIEFNYYSSSLTYSNGDSRYLQLTGGTETGLVNFNAGLKTSTIFNTGTLTLPTSTGVVALVSQIPTSSTYVDLSTNQSVSGQKSFSNIASFTTTNGIPGGQAFNVGSISGGYQTRLYCVNSSYSTDLYYPQFNGIDSLLSTASTATLQNKTYSAPIMTGLSTFPGNTTIDSSGNATFGGTTNCNNSANYPIIRGYKGSSTASAGVVTFQLQQNLGGGQYGTAGGTYMVTMSLQSSDFGLSRGFWTGIIEYSGFAGGKAQGYTITSNNASFTSVSTGGLLTITVTASTSATYEFTQVQCTF